MTRSLPLGTRTLLYSCLPLCLVLGASFFFVSAGVKQRVSRGLKASIVRTEEKAGRANIEFNRRAGRLIAALSENAGLKAGMDLVHQIPSGDPMRAQALKTVEDQLSELSQVVECDFLSLTDSDGDTLAVVRPNTDHAAIELDEFGQRSRSSGFIIIQGLPYEIASAPVNLGGKYLGELSVGRRFDLA